MPGQDFIAFYPSLPFWAGSKVNFSDQTKKNWFYDQMAEEVFSKSTEKYTLKVCRDGRIMLRIEAFEKKYSATEWVSSEDAFQRWSEYLDYLNALYLLLTSSTIEISNTGYFKLHEITSRDAFRVSYENNKFTGESITMESIASVFQNVRYLSSFLPGVPIQHDPRISMRQVIFLDVFKHLSSLFSQVIDTPGLEKTLAIFAKSLSEFKIYNYETSIILSWFITETVINNLWHTHIENLNKVYKEGEKRIDKDRRKLLEGKDFTMNIITNMLELWELLPYSLFKDIDKVRHYRNNIAHGDKKFNPTVKNARLAMRVAHAMIEQEWGLQFIPDVSYSVQIL